MPFLGTSFNWFVCTYRISEQEGHSSAPCSAVPKSGRTSETGSRASSAGVEVRYAASTGVGVRMALSARAGRGAGEAAMASEATLFMEAGVGRNTTSAGAGVWDTVSAGADAGSSFPAGAHIVKGGGTTGRRADAP